ncbi:polygalacturonase-like [Papaver somniferum]|uniref:polygalacturonase-like n=1 Tax=Papaver somniferum TaxID=3469 RepID=UPI000E6FFF5E|nr:polygalacturonase-like [Papaver somniferum]
MYLYLQRNVGNNSEDQAFKRMDVHITTSSHVRLANKDVQLEYSLLSMVVVLWTLMGEAERGTPASKIRAFGYCDNISYFLCQQSFGGCTLDIYMICSGKPIVLVISRTNDILHIIFLTMIPSCANAIIFNVQNFGAKANNNGRDSTKAFLQAWSLACSSTAPAMMWIPRGTYLVNTIAFNGACKSARVTVRIDGKIQAPPSSYWEIWNYGNWILFQGINGLTVNGGILDARGSPFWICRRASADCPQGATSLSFNNVKNGIISGVVSIDSQKAHMAINGCKSMKIRKVTLIAPSQSPNTDGIDIESSTGIKILDSSIKTGDDCIAIGPGTKSLLVQRIACGPRHGISIGSLARSPNEAGVEGIKVKDVTFTGSDNGLRIKTWPKPSDGFVKNVLYQNIVMNNVRNPIIIDQIYCPGTKGCSDQNSGLKISGVTYLNVTGTSATPIAISFHCSATTPCDGIKLYNVNLTYSKQPAKSYCFSALGTSSAGQPTPGSCF